MSDLRGGSTVAGNPIIHQGNMFGMLHSMLDFEITGQMASTGKIDPKSGKLSLNLTIPGGKYFHTNHVAGLNLNNSDMIGLNALYFGDFSEGPTEGINFRRSSGSGYDALVVQDSQLYIYANRASKSPDDIGNKYKFWHEGNHGNGSGLDADKLRGVTGDNFTRNAKAGTMNSVQVLDTRSTSNAPYARGKGIFFDFKYNTTLNQSDADTYAALITFTPWPEMSGGMDNQLSFNSKGMRLRRSTSATDWGPWWTIWHSGNDGGGSGLDADKVHGKAPSYSGVGDTVTLRDGSGDITARLFRTTYGASTTVPPTTAEFIFRYSSSDNYMRPISAATFKEWIKLLKVDADTLRGINGSRIPQFVSTGSTSDPNTTTESYILTNHANNPTGGGTYFHITTHFYHSIGGNCSQIAVAYNGSTPLMYYRHRYSSTWYGWKRVANAESDGKINASKLVGRDMWTASTAPSYTGRVAANCYFTATKVFNQVYGDIGEWMKIAPNEEIIPGKAYVMSPEGLRMATKFCDKKVVGICTDQAAMIINGEPLRDDDGEIIDGLQGIDSNGDPAICIAIAGRIATRIVDGEPGDFVCTTEDGDLIATDTLKRGVILGKILEEPPLEDGRRWILHMMV